MAATSYGPPRRPPQRPKADQPEPAAGRWESGQFVFATPAAAEAWQRSAYQQAVNAKTWHLGDKIDDQTRDAILAGIGGATRPVYQGPDGQYYFQNVRTLEDSSARSHRAQHVAGKTMDQIAAAGKIPGEDEYVATQHPPQSSPANDNLRGGTAAANDNRGARRTIGPSGFHGNTAGIAPEQSRIVNGRVAGMQKASESPGVTLEEFAQAADDYIRLGAAGVTGGYADDAAASLNAFFSMLGGADFSEALAANRAEERRLTDGARERRGSVGTVTETAPGFIPVIGDLSGLLADFKDYLENGDQWTAADWALVAAGIVPGMPNRKTVKAGKKIVSDAVDSAHDTDGRNLLQEGRQKPRTIDDMLPTADGYHTEGQARTLNTEPIGMMYVQEKPSKNLRANEHEDGAEGQLYSIETGYPFKPALRLKNSDPRGRDFMKFDGREIYTDHILMIERKTSYPWGRTKGMRQILVNYRKSREALAQNNDVGEGEPVFKIMYELGTEEEAARALDHMIQEGVDDILAVRVGKRWDEQND